jgi:AcrR family transcriptional regulator
VTRNVGSTHGNEKMSRAEKGEMTRQRIIETAAELFSKKGYNGVSQRELAKAAGITKALLYHHYESKEMIYAEVRSLYRAKFQNDVGQILREHGDDPSHLIHSLAERFEFYRNHPEMARMAMWGFLEGSPLDPPSTTETRESASRLIDIAKQQGVIREIIDPEMLRAMISALIFGWFAMKDSSLTAGDPTVDDQYLQQMLEMIVRGIGTEKLGAQLEMRKQ